MIIRRLIGGCFLLILCSFNTQAMPCITNTCNTTTQEDASTTTQEPKITPQETETLLQNIKQTDGEPTLEDSITLAELYTILIKVREDIENCDDASLLKVLHAKEAEIKKRLDKIKDNPTQYIALLQKYEHMHDNTVPKVIIATTVMAVLTILTIAAYEPTDGKLHWPEPGRARSNAASMIQPFKKLINRA